MAAIVQNLSSFQQVLTHTPWTWLDVSRGVWSGLGSIAWENSKEAATIGWLLAPVTLAGLVQDIFKKDCSRSLINEAGVFLAVFNWSVMYGICEEAKHRDGWHYKLWKNVSTIVVIGQIYLTVRQIERFPMKSCVELVSIGVWFFESKKMLGSPAQKACKGVMNIANVWLVYKGSGVEKVRDIYFLVCSFFPNKINQLVSLTKRSAKILTFATQYFL